MKAKAGTLLIAALAVGISSVPMSAREQPPSRERPSAAQGKGFGDDLPVTLPADRRPPAGTSTGIPIQKETRVPPLPYFRPK